MSEQWIRTLPQKGSGINIDDDYSWPLSQLTMKKSDLERIENEVALKYRKRQP